MTLRIALSLSLLGLLSSACGPLSVCDRLPAAQRTLTTKRGSCAVTLTLSNPAGCDAAFASRACTSSDEAGLNRVLDCYERMTPCTPGNESTFLSQFNSCNSSTGVARTCTF